MLASQVNPYNRLSRAVFEKAMAQEPYREWVKGVCPFVISAFAGMAIDVIARMFIDFFGKGSIGFAAVAWDVRNNAAVGWLPEILGVIVVVGVFVSLVFKDQNAYDCERKVNIILLKYQPNDFILPYDIQQLKHFAPPNVWSHLYVSKKTT